MLLFSVWSSVSLVSVSLLHVLFSCLAFSFLIMCEATKAQLQDRKLHKVVKTLYNTKISVIMNAIGKDAEYDQYPGDPKVVAFSPYHAMSRDRKTVEAVEATKHAWSRGEMVGFHCKNTFHRGVVIFNVTMLETFGSDPEDIMRIV